MTWAQIAFSRLTISACKTEGCREKGCRKKERDHHPLRSALKAEITTVYVKVALIIFMYKNPYCHMQNFDYSEA